MAFEAYAKRRRSRVGRNIFLLCGGNSPVVSPQNYNLSDARVPTSTSSKYRVTLGTRICSLFREIWSHIKPKCLKEQTEVIEISIGGFQPFLSDPTLSVLVEENNGNVPCPKTDVKDDIQNMKVSTFMKELRRKESVDDYSSDSSSRASSSSSGEESLCGIEDIAGADVSGSESTHTEAEELHQKKSIYDGLAPQFSTVEMDESEQVNMPESTNHNECDLKLDYSSQNVLQLI